MNTLTTVTGPLPADAVTGPVLPHEHLALDLARPADPAAVLGAPHEAAVTAELAALRTGHGLALVVDQTCRGMGRDPAALARISRTAGVAVIASTGWYHEAFHPPGTGGADPAELAASLVAEIEHGIGDGGRDGGAVRPGLIGEIGSSGTVPAPAETRTLRAAARAALATGLSVATHAHLGRGGRAQLDLLTAEGLPPHRVCLGHQDLLGDPAELAALAADGAYLALDTVGKSAYAADADRLRLLLALLDAGHAERTLLSCDISRHGYLRSAGGQGYGHLFRSFLPAARAAGVDEATIDLLTRRNPLRFLTGTTGGGL